MGVNGSDGEVEIRSGRREVHLQACICANEVTLIQGGVCVT